MGEFVKYTHIYDRINFMLTCKYIHRVGNKANVNLKIDTAVMNDIDSVALIKWISLSTHVAFHVLRPDASIKFNETYIQSHVKNDHLQHLTSMTIELMVYSEYAPYLCHFVEMASPQITRISLIGEMISEGLLFEKLTTLSPWSNVETLLIDHLRSKQSRLKHVFAGVKSLICLEHERCNFDTDLQSNHYFDWQLLQKIEWFVNLKYCKTGIFNVSWLPNKMKYLYIDFITCTKLIQTNDITFAMHEF